MINLIFFQLTLFYIFEYMISKNINAINFSKYFHHEQGENIK